MPLKKGSSKSTLKYNIRELMKSYKRGGKFAKGKSSKKAHKMAVAAAFNMKKSRRKK